MQLKVQYVRLNHLNAPALPLFDQMCIRGYGGGQVHVDNIQVFSKGLSVLGYSIGATWQLSRGGPVYIYVPI